MGAGSVVGQPGTSAAPASHRSRSFGRVAASDPVVGSTPLGGVPGVRLPIDVPLNGDEADGASPVGPELE
jgi:hypothetical protein